MSSWALYFAIAHEGTPEALREGFKYFLFNVAGAGFLFLGIGLIVAYTGTGEFAGVAKGFASLPPAVGTSIMILMAVGFCMKAAQVSLRIDWQMHPALAPTPVSGYISSVLLKIAVFGLVKLFLVFGSVYAQSPDTAGLFSQQAVMYAAAWIGAFTLLYSAVQAMLQNSLKLVFIWSTVSQIGYMVLGVAVGTSLGMAGGLLHMANHVFFKDLLFLMVGAVMLLSASGNAAVLTLFGMSVGTSVAVINYISRIFEPIESLGMEIQTIQSAMAGVKRIDAFLAQPEREQPPARATAARGDVVLDHVTFGYGEKHVLEDFSMTVKQGEQVTLVGRTGAGKSTVFRLLLGLYPPEAGTVTIGGVKVSDITDRERRTCIGCVEQHLARVPGTVLEQITLGDPAISREMARRAAELAGMDAVIRALPQGCDTLCTDGMFSQGEWQLLSIARAAAADPAVLLLDEITANLDAETEARVLEALRRASVGRTVLSVSHRIYENLGGRTVEIRTQGLE